MMKLTIDNTYDISALTLTGWTDGDGTGHDGYNLHDFFDAANRYLGPDKHGIEPIIEAANT